MLNVPGLRLIVSIANCVDKLEFENRFAVTYCRYFPLETICQQGVYELIAFFYWLCKIFIGKQSRHLGNSADSAARRLIKKTRVALLRAAGDCAESRSPAGRDPLRRDDTLLAAAV